MKYKIAVTETMSATRYIEVEYDEDIDELLHDVENSPYEEDVASTVEDEKEFLDDMKTIDKYEAFKMLAKSRIEDGGELGAEEAFNQLENLEANGEVLLIDSGLL